MNFATKIFISFLIGFSIGYIGSYLYNEYYPNHKEEGISSHTTDTIYVDKPYEVQVPGKNSTIIKPYTVTIYKDTGRTRFIPIPDSIWKLKKDSIQQVLKTGLSYQDWATRYGESQLLNLTLKQDTLDLSLFNPDFRTYQKKYPINLTKFTYEYYGGEIYTWPVKTKKPSFHYLGEAGYDFLKSSPFGSLEVYREFKGLPVFIRADYLILNPQQSTLRTGVRYQFK